MKIRYLLLASLLLQSDTDAMERTVATHTESPVHLRNLRNAISMVSKQSDVERLLPQFMRVDTYGEYGWVQATAMLIQTIKDKNIPFRESVELIIQTYGAKLAEVPETFNPQILEISNLLNSCRHKWVSSESITNFYESERMVSARKSKPKQLLKNTQTMLEKELAQKNQEIAKLKQEKKDTLEWLEQLQSSINESNATALDADVLAVRVPRSLDPFVRWLVFLLDTIVRRTASHYIAPDELVGLRAPDEGDDR